MARAESLAGTPDELALPDRLKELQERLDSLENPDTAVLGGGFIITTDENNPGVVNLETADGKKHQLFPPLVTTDQIKELFAAVTPTVVDFHLARGMGSITKVGNRVWLSGHCEPINAPGWHTGKTPLAVVPEEYRPEQRVRFAVACQAWPNRPPTTRIDVEPDGRIFCYSQPALNTKVGKEDVWTRGDTTSRGHSHNLGGANPGNSGSTAAPELPAHTHTIGHGHSISGGDHSHGFDRPSTKPFVQTVSVVQDESRYPNWVDLDGATWTLTPATAEAR
ncbi:hypothetical protein [Streptomyces sp. NBC_01304]|uniref:hypothetical protein n=1 Tax=Streptomyces sp. NBC_01304 TaxID=2903818 RepID=UPI002E12526E|nr:hypothetical protein OG430_44715 [Streptomyces sp. NBC_01304]